jgi:predicted CopG family antitoxin
MQQETHKNDAAGQVTYLSKKSSNCRPRQKTIGITISAYKELEKLSKESGLTLSNVIASLIGQKTTKHRYIKYYEMEVGQDMLVPWHDRPHGTPPNSSVIIRAIRTQASKYNMEFTWKREQKGLRVIRIR